MTLSHSTDRPRNTPRTRPSRRPYRPRRVLAGASALTLLLTAVGACGHKDAGAAEAGDSARSFYNGKILQVIVPYGPGGGYDQWARALAPYLQKYLGVATVHIDNKLGSGGLLGTSEIYDAEPDGLTIGDTNAGGDVFNQIDDTLGLHLDMSKVNWIGRPDGDPHLIVTHADGPYPTFAKLVDSGRRITALATGKGSADYNATVIVFNAFKVPFTMSAAFTGSSDEKEAFLGGKGATASLSASDALEITDKANSVLLMSETPFDELPHVPTVIQEAEKRGVDSGTLRALHALSDVMDLGHAFFAPPGVPPARLAALRDAFRQAVRDPGFAAAVKKAGLFLEPESDTFLARTVDTALGQRTLFEELLRTG
ncbi:tripartite tricarboxylate transporter substrate-binding protein [Actinacidiphila alni]|uniref:Bug family tripartite tricarboxylate transporter substrate binding protein n=1 Tax=Actinacidiphila alni TaxID=380248 RepID=UPI00340B4963